MRAAAAHMRARWSAYLDRQHRCPAGPAGRLIGERMRRQHRPETDWSVELLRLGAADRALEIGFGAGRGLALLLKGAPRGQVVGVDLSEAMLRAAARRNRAAAAEGRLALLRADLARLPFGARRFDKILSIHTFYFWPEPAAVCRRLVDLLAPDGRLVCTFATAVRRPDGGLEHWPVHQQAEALVRELRRAGLAAQLAPGPDSRRYNNVAIIVDAPAAARG